MLILLQSHWVWGRQLNREFILHALWWRNPVCSSHGCLTQSFLLGSILSGQTYMWAVNWASVFASHSCPTHPDRMWSRRTSTWSSAFLRSRTSTPAPSAQWWWLTAAATTTRTCYWTMRPSPRRSDRMACSNSSSTSHSSSTWAPQAARMMTRSRETRISRWKRGVTASKEDASHRPPSRVWSTLGWWGHRRAASRPGMEGGSWHWPHLSLLFLLPQRVVKRWGWESWRLRRRWRRWLAAPTPRPQTPACWSPASQGRARTRPTFSSPPAALPIPRTRSVSPRLPQGP